MAVDTVSLISQLGFPVFVAIYLLFERRRFEKVIGDNTTAIKQLTWTINGKKGRR